MSGSPFCKTDCADAVLIFRLVFLIRCDHLYASDTLHYKIAMPGTTERQL